MAHDETVDRFIASLMHELRLPLELISQILDLLDRQGLLTLRQANRAFHALTTRLAFRELTVTDTVRSAQGLVGLQSSPDIVECVTSVVFLNFTLGKPRSLQISAVVFWPLLGFRTQIQTKA